MQHARMRASCALHLLLAFALVWPAMGIGKSDDAEQPVHVEADTAELNERTGTGIYRGNVRITQGSMTLTADEVTFIAPDRELRKVIARSQGGKATFRRLTDGGDELFAEARRMEYEPDKERIILLGDAVLRTSANRVGAERIVYQLDRQVVDADDPQGKGRVKMTLMPEEQGELPEGQ
jgi:lipopolysaccharide export system protein LptA